MNTQPPYGPDPQGSSSPTGPSLYPPQTPGYPAPYYQPPAAPGPVNVAPYPGQYPANYPGQFPSQYQYPVPPMPAKPRRDPAGGFSFAGLWIGIASCVLAAASSGTGASPFYAVYYGAFPLGVVGIVLSAIGLYLRARRGVAGWGLGLSILATVAMLNYMFQAYNKLHP